MTGGTTSRAENIKFPQRSGDMVVMTPGGIWARYTSFIFKYIQLKSSELPVITPWLDIDDTSLNTSFRQYPVILYTVRNSVSQQLCLKAKSLVTQSSSLGTDRCFFGAHIQDM